MKDLIRKHPVRITAFVSSTVALIIALINPELPTEQAIIFVLSALGLGEFAQRIENEKTVDALYTDAEDLDLD